MHIFKYAHLPAPGGGVNTSTTVKKLNIRCSDKTKRNQVLFGSKKKLFSPVPEQILLVLIPKQ